MAIFKVLYSKLCYKEQCDKEVGVCMQTEGFRIGKMGGKEKFTGCSYPFITHFKYGVTIMDFIILHLLICISLVGNLTDFCYWLIIF